MLPEYGTVKKEDEFHALLRNSTYANVKPGVKLPAVLFEHGVNDSRVDVWMTTKTAAPMAASTASDAPNLMRLDVDAPQWRDAETATPGARQRSPHQSLRGRLPGEAHARQRLEPRVVVVLEPDAQRETQAFPQADLVLDEQIEPLERARGGLE